MKSICALYDVHVYTHTLIFLYTIYLILNDTQAGRYTDTCAGDVLHLYSSVSFRGGGALGFPPPNKKSCMKPCIVKLI